MASPDPSSSLPSFGTQYAASTLGHLSLNERSRLQNQNRSWERKLRTAETKRREEAEEVARQQDKKQEEKLRAEAVANVLTAPFRPSATAVLDPKAYFAEWTRHQDMCKTQAAELGRRTPANSKRCDLGGRQGICDIGAQRTSPLHKQLHLQQRVVASASAGLQEQSALERNATSPAVVEAPSKRQKVHDGRANRGYGDRSAEVTGMGLLGTYGDSDDD
eukprot:TRINITY_DN56622_c0_g1_i1.p1 TRINITY_DN56622_c0_g1~~TRINITY_DN56622_c0_g1_i1.p1  ORF type:complete len:235 (+),score=48.93 TRINITY_DN56622_c0_g1_i1:49-705(+)